MNWVWFLVPNIFRQFPNTFWQFFDWGGFLPGFRTSFDNFSSISSNNIWCYVSHAPLPPGAERKELGPVCKIAGWGPSRKNEAECDDVINLEIRLCTLQILVDEISRLLSTGRQIGQRWPNRCRVWALPSCTTVCCAIYTKKLSSELYILKNLFRWHTLSSLFLVII